MRHFTTNRKRRLRFESLETRRVLAGPDGELVELLIDVTQDQNSIVAEDRSFSVNAGQRFNVELQYSDLRPRFDAVGVFGYHAELMVESSSAFRPVVGERQIVELIGDFASATGGEIILGAEGVVRTEKIPLENFNRTTFRTAFRQAVASVLDLQEDDFKVVSTTTFSESLTSLEVRFVGDDVVFRDIANLTLDTSGITGTTIDVQPTEIPAFVNKDPGQGINPEAFVTSIDFSSPSLNGLEVYSGGGTYVAGDEVPFQNLNFFGPFTSGLDSFAADNGATFDPEAFTVASIRMEAIEPVSDATFQIKIDQQGERFALYDGILAFEIEPDQILVDTEDDPAVPGDDRRALAIANAFPTQRPFQNPDNPFDVDGDGQVRPSDAILVLGELTNRFVSNADGSLKQPIPDPVPAFYDVNGDNLITLRDFDLVRLALNGITDFETDFGDAPTASQSGFASSYPTKSDDDGARHVIGSLRLGVNVSGELDGTPSASASADSGDDGVVLGASLPVSRGEESTAKVQITPSEAGVIDAWIDFNRDGDWDDVGEKIFDAKAVDAGTAEYEFIVPGNSVEGTTFARFRISSEGTPSPTGLALDGEVEDYAVVIEEIETANPTLDLLENVRIRNVDGDLVIDDGEEVIFARPLTELESLTLVGSSQANQVTLDTSGGSFIPPQGLDIDGGEGGNSLILTGDLMIDATAGNLFLRQFETLDLSGPAASSFQLDAAAVERMVPNSGTLRYLGAEEDRLLFSDANQWQMGNPVVTDNIFLQTAINDSFGLTIEADVVAPYQNLIDPSDVTNQAGINARDAFLIISELIRRAFSSSDNGAVNDPLTVDPWPGIYPDQDGNNLINAKDALRVINHLIRQSQNIEQEFVTPNVDSATSRIAAEDSLLEVTDEPTVQEEHSTPKKVTLEPALQPRQPFSDDLLADFAIGDSLEATELSTVDSLLGDDVFLESLSDQ